MKISVHRMKILFFLFGNLWMWANTCMVVTVPAMKMDWQGVDEGWWVFSFLFATFSLFIY